jgi:hypothetical protein
MVKSLKALADQNTISLSRDIRAVASIQHASISWLKDLCIVVGIQHTSIAWSRDLNVFAVI